MTAPIHHHDQNPTRTHGNTKPEYLIMAEKNRDDAYDVINYLAELETERTPTYYQVLEFAKEKAVWYETIVNDLYEKWQRDICTHPEHARETSYSGGWKFVGGDVIDTVTETVICRACGKDITDELG